MHFWNTKVRQLMCKSLVERKCLWPLKSNVCSNFLLWNDYEGFQIWKSVEFRCFVGSWYFYWYLINFMKYAFGWQGYLYKKGNEMETKRQVRKEGILSEFFDGKWNCTGGNFLTPKDLQLDGKARINAFNFAKKGEICLCNAKGQTAWKMMLMESGVHWLVAEIIVGK